MVADADHRALGARAGAIAKIEALDAVPTTTSPSPSASANCWRACAPHCDTPCVRDPERRCCTSGTPIVDLEKRPASRDGDEIRLTPIEFRLLAALAKHLGHGRRRTGSLLTEVWGPTHASDTHYLRIYMKQLREKLEPDPVRPRHLVTETGVGYRLLADD